MSNSVRIVDSLLNTPVLALPSVLDSVVSYLDSRSNGAELSTLSPKNPSVRTPEFNSVTKTGTLRISGPLTYRNTILSTLCNLTSYQSLEADFRKLIDLGAKTVVMVIDSGGGEAYSAFETAALLKTLADKHSIKIISYADGISASAAYAFAAVSHEFVMNPEAEAGSIGCVVKLRNTNKSLKNAGIEDTFIFSGKNKIPFNKSGEWSSDFLSGVQSKVDSVYQKFTQFVATHRKLPVQAVIDTQAKMFSANDAIKIGLADKVMTREQFSKYLLLGASQPTKTIAPLKATLKATSPSKPSLKQPVPKEPEINGVRKALLQMFPENKK